tara:strand:- start:820 stop:1005 length:186 start_codon:yes stop_codon:yes gene_type:complete
MLVLYLEREIRKGKVVTRLARVAPAPKKTKKAGMAQQIKVEVEANKDNIFTVFSFRIKVII